MNQTFKKRLQGHELEFNRLLFPLRYNIIIKSPGYEGLNIIAQKDESGEWNLKQCENFPSWLCEISTDIHETLQDNERLALKAV